MKYSYTVYIEQIGYKHEFTGPGLSRYSSGVYFNQDEERMKSFGESPNWADYQANYVIGMLYKAFEAGREDAKREFREFLGIKR